MKKKEPAHVRGICAVCNKNPQKKNTKTTYKPICSGCSKRLYEKNTARNLDNKKRPYRKYLKDKCEHCGFIPLHKCQLDVDHIDGDHKNNAPENLQTLCANCHRLKTYLEQDWKSPLD